MPDSKRILVVDDEEYLTFSLYQNFIMSNFEGEVMTASNADSALEKFNEKRFDVVLTDIAMPGMSGLDLLREIKTLDENTSVILMTAYPEIYKDKVEGIGADGFLEKPFDSKVVRDLVMSFLGD